jgi:hypothetical protein
MSALTGPVTGAAGPLAVAVVVGAHVSTAVGVVPGSLASTADPLATIAVIDTPTWSFFDPSMGGAPTR